MTSLFRVPRRYVGLVRTAHSRGLRKPVTILTLRCLPMQQSPIRSGSGRRAFGAVEAGQPNQAP